MQFIQSILPWNNLPQNNEEFDPNQPDIEEDDDFWMSCILWAIHMEANNYNNIDLKENLFNLSMIDRKD